MTLGKLISNYCGKENISLREFSRRSGISITQISYLINGRHDAEVNPKPITYKKVAKAMGLHLSEVVSMTDAEDMFPVSSEEEVELFRIFRGLSLFERQTVLELAREYAKESKT